MQRHARSHVAPDQLGERQRLVRPLDDREREARLDRAEPIRAHAEAPPKTRAFQRAGTHAATRAARRPVRSRLAGSPGQYWRTISRSMWLSSPSRTIATTTTSST